MEAENSKKSAADSSDTDENVSFHRVASVVTRWSFDFMFLSLCRHFKQQKHHDFNEALSSFEAISQSTSLNGATDVKKKLICAFLSRVMHAKELDVQNEKDGKVMPLMSATKAWFKLKDTVADRRLFKSISSLLLVQTVAVCLEKGQSYSASSALKWFEENYEFPQTFGVKLRTIVKQKETYHPFLMSFSFSRLREEIQCYLDDYLEKNPCDYLLKAATKVVQLSKKSESLEDMALGSSLTETSDNSAEETEETETAVRLGTKRKLLSRKISDLFKPDSCKKPFVSLNNHEMSKKTPDRSADMSLIHKTKKARQKWTYQLDKYLKEGVKRHGVGNWSRILLDYDFEGRTGTMLKDRWRILMKAHEVS